MPCERFILCRTMMLDYLVGIRPTHRFGDNLQGRHFSVIPQASMLSSKSEDSKGGSSSRQAKNTRRDSIMNRRAGLKTALNVSIRTPKLQSLPSYLVKVLLSLVQARLEAQV